MNQRTRQGLGLLVVAVLAFLVFLPSQAVNTVPTAIAGMIGGFTMVVCAIVGLVLLAIGLLRPGKD